MRIARLRRFWSDLWQDRTGMAALLFAFSLTALMGAAAAAVDVGSLFLAKRQLQGLADSAVLAAATGDITGQGTASAQAVITQTGVSGVTITQLVPGSYARDSSVAVANRFTATSVSPSAAQLTLQRNVPLFFAKIFGKSTLVISARATAAQVNMAGFTIGTKTVGLSGGLANSLLSSLAGTNLNLSLIDTQGLASADVDILGFANALAVRVNAQGGTYASVFGANVPLGTIVQALTDVAPNSAVLATLQGMAGKMPNASVRLSDLIDLGPIGNQNAGTPSDGALRVDILSFLRSLLVQSKGGSFNAALDLTIPGLTSVKLIIAGGGTATSPFMTVTQAKDVVVRTAAMRIYLDAQVGTSLAGLVSIRFPVYAELAASEARLSAIQCSGTSSDGVTLAVTPSVGSIAIADVPASDIPNFAVAISKQPAVLANVLGVIKVTAFANIALGGMSSQSVLFSKSDIANHVTKTITTNDLTTGIATSLAQSMVLSVTTLGITVNAGPLVGSIAGLLLSIAPPLDGLLNQVTGLLGVKLGAADVRVDKMRCGVPMLVA